ncbi:MAG TPA: PilZ domain-containing protein [Allosphingosinicella sp.]|nr:PilZ domain-containing protein [Allosphingosinicella sp.]
MITARIAVLGGPGERGTVRRRSDFTGYVRDARSTGSEARVSDLSVSGCRLTPARDLEPQAEVWVKLGGYLPQRASIAWVQDGQAGCEFCTPLSIHIVEELLFSDSLAPKARFTRR